MSEELLVFIDQSNIGNINPEQAKNRWNWVYADGKFEEDYGYDIVLFNQPEPNKDGYYLAKAENGKTVLVRIETLKKYPSTLKGRCCYIDDYESLKMVNEPETWR